MTCLSIGVTENQDGQGSGNVSIRWREIFLGFYTDEISFMRLFQIFSHITVEPNEGVILRLGKLTYNPVTNVSRQYIERYKWAKGAGTFSPIGNVTVGEDIIFESSFLVASAADINLPNTVIRNLGNLPEGSSFLDVINYSPEGIDLSDVTKTYLIQYVISGIAYLFIFRGGESSQGYGIYGSGFLQATEGDFNPFTDSGSIPDNETRPFEIKGIYANNTAALEAGLEQGDIYQIPEENNRAVLAVVFAAAEPEPPVFDSFVFDNLQMAANNLNVNDIESAADWNNAIRNWSAGQSNVNYTHVLLFGNNNLNLGGNNLQVTYLDMHETGLVDTSLYYLANLEFLDLSYNSIENEMYYSSWPNLSTCIVNNNLMRWLNVSGNANLKNLICSNNQLISANVGTPSLEILDIKTNPELDTITGLEQCTGLKNIDASGCALTSFDGNSLVALQELRLRRNNLPNLFLNNSPVLSKIYLMENQISDFGPLSLFKDGVTVNLFQNQLPEEKIAAFLNYINDNNIVPAEINLSGPGNAPVTGESLALYDTLRTAGINITCNT